MKIEVLLGDRQLELLQLSQNQYLSTTQLGGEQTLTLRFERSATENGLAEVPLTFEIFYLQNVEELQIDASKSLQQYFGLGDSAQISNYLWMLDRQIFDSEITRLSERVALVRITKRTSEGYEGYIMLSGTALGLEIWVISNKTKLLVSVGDVRIPGASTLLPKGARVSDRIRESKSIGYEDFLEKLLASLSR